MKTEHTKTIPEMIDITAPNFVEVDYAHNGVLWVNIDGICRLRCCRIKWLKIGPKEIDFGTFVPHDRGA